MSLHISQDRLLTSESSSYFIKVWFCKQDFSADKSISNIKYNYSGSQNNNLFNLFNDQQNYILANYFEKLETVKSNVDKFLFDLLTALFTEKQSYQNYDKWREKYLKIL